MMEAGGCMGWQSRRYPFHWSEGDPLWSFGVVVALVTRNSQEAMAILLWGKGFALLTKVVKLPHKNKSAWEREHMRTDLVPIYLR